MSKLFTMKNKNKLLYYPINVLSLFDGISCGHVALDRAGIQIKNYYASEINSDSIKVTNYNFPQTIQLGDITKIDFSKLQDIDLLIGGSPCQDISNLNNKQLGLQGDKSRLFYKFVEALIICKPRYFLLENVCGKKESVDTISHILSVPPIKINSNLVSAQNRNRLYWTNITGVSQPKDCNIALKDILQPDDETFSYILKDGRLKWLKSKSGINCISSRYASLDATKANCLTARGEKSWNSNYVTRKDGKIRTLTPIEYERLQTLPDNYTSIISDSSRYEALGNGWTVDVIAHILSYVSQEGIYL